MTKEQQYEEILQLFVSKDSLRAWMNTPFVMPDGRICSTDAHALVIVPTAEKKYESGDVKPATISHIESLFTGGKTKEDRHVSVEEVRKALDKIPHQDDYNETHKKCDVCKGEGEVEWEFKGYTKEDECPKCDGDGEVLLSRTKNGLKYYSAWNTIIIKFCGVPFNPNYIEKMLKVASILDQTQIQIVSSNGKNKHVSFRIQDVDLIIMPMSSVDTYTVAGEF